MAVMTHSPGVQYGVARAKGGGPMYPRSTVREVRAQDVVEQSRVGNEFRRVPVFQYVMVIQKFGSRWASMVACRETSANTAVEAMCLPRGRWGSGFREFDELSKEVRFPILAGPYVSPCLLAMTR